MLYRYTLSSTAVVVLICLADVNVITIYNLSVVDTPSGALQVALEAGNEHIGALDSQMASKDARLLAKWAELDNLERKITIGKEMMFLASATTREQGSQLHAADAVPPTTKAALCSAEPQCQLVPVSESSVGEEMSQLQKDKTHL